jgi:hypothetical protein
MYLFGRQRLLFFVALWLLSGVFSVPGFGQQVVQRGALGRPGQVLDETQQWSTPLLVAADADVELYIPDLTGTEWLKRNYSDYMNKAQYVVSMVTFYKTTKACRKNQIGWGNGDAAHLNACNDIGYRVRQALIDTNQKAVTLIMAAMVDQNGEIVPSSIQQDSVMRTWADLDVTTREALKKTNALVAEQMRIYHRKLQPSH